MKLLFKKKKVSPAFIWRQEKKTELAPPSVTIINPRYPSISSNLLEKVAREVISLEKIPVEYLIGLSPGAQSLLFRGKVAETKRPHESYVNEFFADRFGQSLFEVFTHWHENHPEFSSDFIGHQKDAATRAVSMYEYLKALSEANPYIKSHLLSFGYDLEILNEVQIYWGLMLHDIGKYNEAIFRALEKPGKLNKFEKNHTQVHPTLGANLFYLFLEKIYPEGLNDPHLIHIYSSVLRAIYEHHEWFDIKRVDNEGETKIIRGYPRGISGKAVSLEGVLAGIADVIAALLERRTYKMEADEDEIINILQNMPQMNPFIISLLRPFLRDIIQATPVRGFENGYNGYNRAHVRIPNELLSDNTYLFETNCGKIINLGNGGCSIIFDGDSWKKQKRVGEKLDLHIGFNGGELIFVPAQVVNFDSATGEHNLKFIDSHVLMKMRAAKTDGRFNQLITNALERK